MRIGEGNLLFGLDFTTVAPEMAVLACPAHELELLEVDAEQLYRLVGNGGDPGVLVGYIDAWVARTTAAAVDRIPPKQFAFAEPGKEIRVGREPQAVLARESVVWVKHLQGNSRFLGEQAFTINAAGALPLSGPAWLEAQPQSVIASIDTAQYFVGDPEGAGLSMFNRIAAQCFLLNLQRAEEKETHRLSAKAQAGGLALQASLQRLKSPLDTGHQTAAPETDPAADPWLAACRAIGAVTGIDFRQHPNARLGRVQKQPVDDIARASSVRFRQIVLSGKWWLSDAGPFLGIRESDKRPVALLPASARSYDVFDPVDRTRVRVNDKIAEELGPYAFTFYRSFGQEKIGARDLLKFGIRGCERDFAVIAMMGAGAGLLGMLTPVLTGFLFDSIIPGSQKLQLLQVFAFLVASAICTALLQITRGYALVRIEGKMDASLQAAVWDRLLSLPVPFFRDYTAGDLAVRGLGISQMRQMLTGPALNSVISGIFSIFSFGLLFYYSWRLALVATALIGVAFVVSLFTGHRQVAYQRLTARVQGRISGMVLQFVNGISKFRVSGTEARAFASWASEFSPQKKLSFSARRVANRLTVFSSVYPIFASACIFLCISWLMKQPNGMVLSTGDFLAFNAAFGQFLTAALQLSSAIVSVLAVVPLYERAIPILQTVPEVDKAKTDPGELAGNIEISHLAFRYRPEAPQVLRDISIRISAGQFVAIVGSSGCGKSTLFRILLGFETPESGAVFFDGQDVASLDIQAVRRQMGVVLQTAKLLSGSIFNNIVGPAPLTIDDAWEAARMAGFDQDIRQMPMGMHTVVSEGGGGLSGGQRQRLMIARAIVGKPRILLFDEATSALDNQTQAIVSKSLEGLKTTRIVIAHRLSTIINADRIYVLDKGTVVQSGTYEELIAQPGLFAELAKRQLS